MKIGSGGPFRVRGGDGHPKSSPSLAEGRLDPLSITAHLLRAKSSGDKIIIQKLQARILNLVILKKLIKELINMLHETKLFESNPITYSYY